MGREVQMGEEWAGVKLRGDRATAQRSPIKEEVKEEDREGMETAKALGEGIQEEIPGIRDHHPDPVLLPGSKTSKGCLSGL